MTRPLYTHWNAAAKGSRGVCDSLTRFPGVPLAADLEKTVGRHRLVYAAPAGIWQDGLPLGNGDLAAMVYQPGPAFCWGLTKSDIRDLRNPVIPFHAHAEWAKVMAEGRCLEADWMNEEEWEFYREDYFPCFLPAGSLTLTPVRSRDLQVTRQVLDLYTATHRAELTGGGSIESFVFYGANVLAVRLSGLKGKKFRVTLSPEAVAAAAPGHDDTPLAQVMRRELFRRRQYHWSADSASQRVDYADGHRALTVLQARGGTFTPSAQASAVAEFAIQDDQAVLLMTITTAREAAWLQRRAERLLAGAWQRNFDRLHSDHRIFWHERWSRSLIQVPERVLEALWYFDLYTMISSSRGPYPAPLMSAWNLRLDQPYHGDFHNNINSQMTYWPVFAANHPDLAESYFKHFWAVLPELESETRRVWNLPGVKIPFACAGRGKDFWGVGYWKYEFYVSAWTAQIAWWHYQHTLDRKMLEKYGWPLLKAVADFYAAYLERDPATGRLSLPWAKPCEDTVFNSAPTRRLVRDTGLDLAAVQAHFRDTAAAASVLSLTKEARRFQALLENMTPLPVRNGEFAIAPDVTLDLPVSHPYTIAAVYPTELVTRLGPPDLLPIARQTLKNIWRCSSRVTGGGAGRLHWNDDLSMGWLGVVHAWMGDGAAACDAILNGWAAGCLKSNGFLADQARAPMLRPGMMWMQNQLSGQANVITEMLFQSHSGVLQLFPAVPATWRDCAFAGLRARGAFLVSAARRNGKTEWVTVTAEQGGRVRLLSPWPKVPTGKILVFDDCGVRTKKHLHRAADGCLEFDLGAGETVTLAVTAAVFAKPRCLAPAATLAEPWPFTAPALAAPAGEKTWTGWWGKPKA